MDPLRSTFRLPARLGTLFVALTLLLGLPGEPAHSQSANYRLAWESVPELVPTACLGDRVDILVYPILNLKLGILDSDLWVKRSVTIYGFADGDRGTLSPEEIRTDDRGGAFFTYEPKRLGRETIRFSALLRPGLPGIGEPTSIGTGPISFDVEACEYKVDGALIWEMRQPDVIFSGDGELRDVRLKPDAAFENYTGDGTFSFKRVMVLPRNRECPVRWTETESKVTLTATRSGEMLDVKVAFTDVTITMVFRCPDPEVPPIVEVVSGNPAQWGVTEFRVPVTGGNVPVPISVPGYRGSFTYWVAPVLRSSPGTGP